jgi:ribulose-5-phosphate 4-epimerase/fuculose-1-phosphate aldolase
MSDHADDARRDVQARLAAAMRWFAVLDFDEGAAGHLSARDPIEPDHFWINAVGRPFDIATPASLVLVDQGGTVCVGRGAPSRAGFELHSAIYAARADVGSAMHAHPIHAKAWSTLGRLLDPITQEACIFHGRHGLFDEYNAPFSDHSEAGRVVTALGPTNIAMILRNHGLLTVGPSIGAAAYRFMIFDRSCRVQLLAERAGEPVRIDETVAAWLATDERHSHDSFEPIFESMCSKFPAIVGARTGEDHPLRG